ncbi:MAG: Rubrerythrin [Clostridiaceae bacterium]|jgi:rubrerythrin|uniref:ferritin family protein n=1 Tax=Clostridium sp. TaxID=1506 RepID=UPI0025891E9D|nr:ferritin family protein [Clostridium sp.]MDF2505722.1 Rubrerythrin [Clostridium sp.]MDF2884930.1 Rubrerythrin [Clostridiaceae bacterium]
MNNNNFMQNLIQLEENAKLLYERISIICSDRLKETVIKFSYEEELHKEIIQKLFLRIDYEIIPNERILKLIRDQFNFYDKKNLEFEKINEKEFFLIALKIEQSSIEFYTEIIASIDHRTETYKIFNSLIEQEKKHMIKIVKMLHELR